MDLLECRRQIDQLDRDLLKLFIERMHVVQEVVNYKKAHQLPILNAQREQEVLADKIAQCPDDISGYVQAFFVNLMEVSKCYQMELLNDPTVPVFSEKKLLDSAEVQVICQGTQGAYQHIAAKKLFPSSHIHFCKTYPEVFEQVTAEKADFAVVPLENSTAGSVDHVYDLLHKYNLSINRMFSLKIEHCLAAKKGTGIFELTDIYSYIQALNQCSDFLQKYVQLEAHDYPNTALAAEFVANSPECIAAICSAECANLFDLEILQDNIQNSSENYTRFIVISRELLTCYACNELTISVQIPNHPGELNRLLTKFSLYNINMTKIESRPIGDKDFSVLFYISFMGNIKDPPVQKLIRDLAYNYFHFKLLGTYESI